MNLNNLKCSILEEQYSFQFSIIWLLQSAAIVCAVLMNNPKHVIPYKGASNSSEAIL